MTVQTLIKKLSKFPKNTKVRMYINEGKKHTDKDGSVWFDHTTDNVDIKYVNEAYPFSDDATMELHLTNG